VSLVLYKGNRSPSLSDTIKVGGVPFDLTGATVKLRMRLETSSTLKIDATAVVTDAPNGKVRYDWASADVDTAGEYVAWWFVTLSNGKTQDSDEFQVEIRDHSLASGALCSLADVRMLLELPANERTRDELILDSIDEVSDQIVGDFEREFAPQTNATTRRFRVTRLTVDLTPYDLRAATSLSLHPETTSPTALSSANGDYRLNPEQPTEGVYTTITISSKIAATVYNSDTLRWYGYALLDVAGDWGFPSVPKIVRRAASDTVASWLRRDIPALGLDVSELTSLPPEVAATLDVPLAVRRRLNRFRRNVGAF
jgi:hypothetical protein